MSGCLIVLRNHMTATVTGETCCCSPHPRFLPQLRAKYRLSDALKISAEKQFIPGDDSTLNGHDLLRIEAD